MVMEGTACPAGVNINVNALLINLSAFLPRQPDCRPVF